MPYIPKDERVQYDKLVTALVRQLSALGFSPATRKGYYNYVMFTLALKLAKQVGIRYATLQDIVGTFECCKQEFIRRVVSPYEDEAIKRNGDVAGIPTGD